MDTRRGSQTVEEVDNRAMYEILRAFISPLPADCSDSTAISLTHSYRLAKLSSCGVYIININGRADKEVNVHDPS
jgi:hypothetical protein